MKREIENHGAINHPNVLRLLGHNFKGIMHVKGKLDADNTYIYLVTEFLGNNFVNFFDLIEASGGDGFGEDAGRLFLN